MGFFDTEPQMKFLYDEGLNDKVIKEIFLRRFPEYSLRKHYGSPKLKKSAFHQAYVTILPDVDSLKDGKYEYMTVDVESHEPALIRALMGYIIFDIIKGRDNGEFMSEVKRVVEEELSKRFHRVKP